MTPQEAGTKKKKNPKPGFREVVETILERLNREVENLINHPQPAPVPIPVYPRRRNRE
jgi:hypothetical protein